MWPTINTIETIPNSYQKRKRNNSIETIVYMEICKYIGNFWHKFANTVMTRTQAQWSKPSVFQPILHPNTLQSK